MKMMMKELGEIITGNTPSKKIEEFWDSDDVLIFDSDVSKEYLRLYESQCLMAEELENIRKNGLKPIAV